MRWLLALWLAIAPACAQEAVIGSGVSGGVKAAATYTGPGDIVSFTAWYSCQRAYSSTVASPGTNLSCNIRRASDNEQCDFVLTNAGSIGNSTNCTGADNGKSLATFLNATTGAVTKAYDQTVGNACGGASCDVAQATAANQPTITLSCLGSSNCMKSTSTSIALASANNITPASGTVSFSVVGNRAAGTGSSPFMLENGAITGTNINRFGGQSSTANKWIVGGSASLAVTANDAAWHAGNAVMAGASSVVNIDGAENTGTATGITTAGAPHGVTGNSSTTAESPEHGFIDNSSISSTVRTSLCRNQQAYYGAGNFGATC